MKKKIGILVLLLVSFSACLGQIITATHGIIEKRTVDPSWPLDGQPTAVGIFSLRKMLSAYSGSLVRVRRSSDNTEQDIGFQVDGTLDTPALSSFVGSGNGFVVTVYDQSPEAKHLTQATATQQPKIMNSGTLIARNGKPSMNFDGTDDVLIAPLVSTSGDWYPATQSIVFEKATATVGTAMNKGASGFNYGYGIHLESGQIRFRNSNNDFAIGSATWIANVLICFNTVSLNNNTEGRKNGISTGSVGQGTSNSQSGTLTVGARGGSSSSYVDGYISEIVVFHTNLSLSQIQALEANQMVYFGI